MKGSIRISRFIPEIFEASSTEVSGLTPLTTAVNLLCLNEVQILPIVQCPETRINPETGIKEYISFSSYAVLEAILRSDPRNYLNLVSSTKCQDVAIWIGSVRSTDSFDELMRVLELNGFGDAIVEQEEGKRRIGIVTLNDVVSLYKSDRLKSSLLVSDVSCQKISVSSSTSLAEALSLMLTKGIRRLFYRSENSEEDSNLRFASDRGIFSFLFAPQRLEILKMSPESWLDAKLFDIVSGYAKTISDDATINQASRMIGDKVDECLVCESSQEVVSRWDIVMKPWQVDSIEVAAMAT